MYSSLARLMNIVSYGTPTQCRVEEKRLALTLRIITAASHDIANCGRGAIGDITDLFETIGIGEGECRGCLTSLLKVKGSLAAVDDHATHKL